METDVSDRECQVERFYSMLLLVVAVNIVVLVLLEIYCLGAQVIRDVWELHQVLL